MISLVTVFEELSHVTSPFWLRDKMNRVICLFHGQNLRRADIVVYSSAASSWGLPLLFSKLEKRKWFPHFAVGTFPFVH